MGDREPDKAIRDLYSLLCNEVWLRVAAHNVNTIRDEKRQVSTE